MKVFIKVCSALMALAMMAVAQQGAAQTTFPNKPIRIVIGFPAGGAQDVILRTISGKLSENLGVPIVVDNRAGANGNIAAAHVAKSPADGYTLLFNTSSVALTPYLYADPGYDLLKDFAPVVLTANIPVMLVVHPEVPAANVQAFVALLKAKPGKINYGSGGQGNITHLSAVRFLQAIGAEATHVPYKGEPPAMNDLIAGRIQFFFGVANNMIPHVQTGKIRALAVASLKRIAAMPDVPTLNETVAPGLEVGAWSGVLAPVATPPDILARLNAALNKTLEDPELRAKITATSAEVKGSTPAEYATFLNAELERWGSVIRAAGLKPE